MQAEKEDKAKPEEKQPGEPEKAKADAVSILFGESKPSIPLQTPSTLVSKPQEGSLFGDKKPGAFLFTGENKMPVFAPSTGGLFGAPTPTEKKPEEKGEEKNPQESQDKP